MNSLEKHKYFMVRLLYFIKNLKKLSFSFQNADGNATCIQYLFTLSISHSSQNDLISFSIPNIEIGWMLLLLCALSFLTRGLQKYLYFSALIKYRLLNIPLNYLLLTCFYSFHNFLWVLNFQELHSLWYVGDSWGCLFQIVYILLFIVTILLTTYISLIYPQRYDVNYLHFSTLEIPIHTYIQTCVCVRRYARLLNDQPVLKIFYYLFFLSIFRYIFK